MIVLFCPHFIRSNKIDKELLVNKIAVPRVEAHDGKPLLHIKSPEHVTSVSNKNKKRIRMNLLQNKIKNNANA